MAIKIVKKIAVPEKHTTPELLITYLFYALEDMRTLSPRGTQLLANAITALAEEVHCNTEEIKKKMERDLLLH